MVKGGYSNTREQRHLLACSQQVGLPPTAFVVEIGAALKDVMRLTGQNQAYDAGQGIDAPRRSQRIIGTNLARTRVA